MSPGEMLAQWRTEILEELAAVEQELVGARGSLQAAEAALRLASSDFEVLHKFMAAGLRKGEGVAIPLQPRLNAARGPLIAAKSVRGSALAAIESLTMRVAELQDAVRQIDAAVAAERVVELPRSAESTRRKPPVVEYDPLEPPARGSAA